MHDSWGSIRPEILSSVPSPLFGVQPNAGHHWVFDQRAAQSYDRWEEGWGNSGGGGRRGANTPSSDNDNDNTH